LRFAQFADCPYGRGPIHEILDGKLSSSTYGQTNSNQDKTIPLVLRSSCERNEHRIALKDDTRSMSYAEVYETVRRLCGGFHRIGLTRGKTAFVMLDNHVDYLLNWFGLSFIGAVEVPANTAYRGSWLAHVVADSGAELAVVENHYYDRLVAIADQVPALKKVVIRGPQLSPIDARWEHLSFELLLASPPEDPIDVKSWEPTSILYTSGTTGVSKGVLIPHALAYADAHPEYTLGSLPGDTLMGTQPLFHGGGHWSAYNALIVGATAYIMPKFHATNFWEIANRQGCTFAPLVGAMASFLYRQPPRAADREHRIRRIRMTPVMPEVDDFKRRFGVDVGSGYGLTEGGNPICAPVGKAVPGGCGWLRPDYEAQLVDENDYEVLPGQPGELLLRPKLPWTTMLGYQGLPEKSTEIWRNLWLHTGDLMTQDADGQYFFVDRLKDAIRRRGENVSSYELEREINSHPMIQESAVVGVASEHTEQEIKAVVLLRQGMALSAPDLIAYLEPRLPNFMLPRYVEFVDDLPRTPTERVRKQVLRDRPNPAGTWDRLAQSGRESTPESGN